jgi:hypothetical protein
VQIWQHCREHEPGNTATASEVDGTRVLGYKIDDRIGESKRVLQVL